MNRILWVLQAAMAGKFISVAYTHGLSPDQTKMQRGIYRLGSAAGPLLSLVAGSTFVGGVSLVLPAATGYLAWLTPWSAAFLALIMLPAMGIHLVCRESSDTIPGIAIFALVAFSAYGRWAIAPL